MDIAPHQIIQSISNHALYLHTFSLGKKRFHNAKIKDSSSAPQLMTWALTLTNVRQAETSRKQMGAGMVFGT